MEISNLIEWSNEFFSLYPNGNIKEFTKFIRLKEKEHIKLLFEQYKVKHIKQIMKDINKK